MKKGAFSEVVVSPQSPHSLAPFQNHNFSLPDATPQNIDGSRLLSALAARAEQSCFGVLAYVFDDEKAGTDFALADDGLSLGVSAAAHALLPNPSAQLLRLAATAPHFTTPSCHWKHGIQSLAVAHRTVLKAWIKVCICCSERYLGRRSAKVVVLTSFQRRNITYPPDALRKASSPSIPENVHLLRDGPLVVVVQSFVDVVAPQRRSEGACCEERQLQKRDTEKRRL